MNNLKNSYALMGIKFSKFLMMLTYSLIMLQSDDVGIISITRVIKYDNIL